MTYLSPSDQNITESIKDFLKIISPVSKEVSELLADYVRGFRFSNQVRMLTKAKEKLDKAGISPSTVQYKLLVPLLDGCSYEEDDSMIERWANLLANAADPTKHGYVGVTLVEILKQLTPIEALILDRFYDYCNEHVARTAELSPFIIDTSSIQLDAAILKEMVDVEIGEEDFESAMDDLIRLDLLGTADVLATSAEFDEKRFYLAHPCSVFLTRFGYRFISACRIR